jgi:hypothetical protein
MDSPVISGVMSKGMKNMTETKPNSEIAKSTDSGKIPLSDKIGLTNIIFAGNKKWWF